jgi:hypothetical protein
VRSHASLFLTLLTLAVPGRAAFAQASRTSGSLEAGVSNIQQPGYVNAQAFSTSGLWRMERGRAEVVASGNSAIASRGHAAGVAAISTSWLASRTEVSRFDVAASATVVGATNERAVSSAQAYARQHWLADHGGVWMGGSAGGLRRGRTANEVVVAELGAWGAAPMQHLGTVRVIWSAEHTWTRGDQNATSVATETPAHSLRFTDVQVGGSAAMKHVDFEVDGGMRFDHSWGTGFQTHAAASVALWVLPQLAVTGSLGRQLSDRARGTDAVRYASIALRVAARESSPRTTPLRSDGTVRTRARVDVTESANGMTLRVVAPGASHVELMGDFTSWAPVALDKDGVVWRCKTALKSGAHHVLVRVDGGQWMVPANLASVDDDFGGHTGLLIVP